MKRKGDRHRRQISAPQFELQTAAATAAAVALQIQTDGIITPPIQESNFLPSLIHPTPTRPTEPRKHHTQIPPLEPLSELTLEKYCGPTPESNWVIPGKLLVGAFPASENDEDTFCLLSSILKCNINKFVCLQKEYQITGVPEESWRRGQALRPYFEDVMLIVKNKGMFEDLASITDEEKVGFVHCPIVDCGIISDQRILQLAQLVVDCLLKGDCIYLHCWGGHGRTGTVVCLVLHLLYDLPLLDVLERCQRVHDLRRFPVDVSSPQTQEQVDQVARIIHRLTARATVPPTPEESAPPPKPHRRLSLPSARTPQPPVHVLDLQQDIEVPVATPLTHESRQPSKQSAKPRRQFVIDVENAVNAPALDEPLRSPTTSTPVAKRHSFSSRFTYQPSA